MRKISGYPPGELRKYIPESYNNRKDKQPVTVWIKQPSERDKRAINAYGRKTKVYIHDKTKPAEIDDGESQERMSLAISRCVEKVENYSTASGVAIDNGDKFAEHAEDDFFYEVYKEIQSSLSLTDEQVKKSSGSSDISNRVIQVAPGVATNALDLVYETPEEIASQGPVLLT
jgi:hypothetical protein